ncbi:hypothetical protein QUG64_07525 [Acinetobacter lwoffii]|jgi:hypothetical protein|uniref:hypothetical protein n=1 Tax=Acinetobacter TaxID=469 RepID=UPI0011418D49|nr:MULTISPECIES: hypothetical protein [Acinetobacter]MCO8080678.1 hypothetical protein [Acinetobacter lwoffii]MCU4440658.1 hypothetical protein [Acinetobacter lwoffii]QXB40633.1 hypothetical protein I6L23_00855 [Acinetobacter lwoffii]
MLSWITDSSLNTPSGKGLCILLTIISSWITSYYYQVAIHHPFDQDIAFVSTLIGCGILIFLLIASDWSLPLSILAGIIGGVIFSHRATWSIKLKSKNPLT